MIVALLYQLDISCPTTLKVTELASSSPMSCSMPIIPLPGRNRFPDMTSANEPLILLDILPSRTYFTRLLESQGIAPKDELGSAFLELVRGLVGQGLGYSLLIDEAPWRRNHDGQPLAIRPLVEEVEDGVIAIAA